MLKVISKINCPRCENIKQYLEGREIEFEIEMAEDMGYEHWRELIQENTGKLGFPLLLKIDFDNQQTEWLNGSTDEIIDKINEWYPHEKTESAEKCSLVHFDWAICKCGHRGKEYENKE